MNAQLSFFPAELKPAKKGNPYRDMNGKYCTKQQHEVSEKDKEIAKLKNKAAYLAQQVEMFERAYLSVVKQLRQ